MIVELARSETGRFAGSRTKREPVGKCLVLCTCAQVAFVRGHTIIEDGVMCEKAASGLRVVLGLTGQYRQFGHMARGCVQFPSHSKRNVRPSKIVDLQFSLDVRFTPFTNVLFSDSPEDTPGED